MSGSTAELHRLKWFMGQCLALLALWTISALDMAHGPVFLVTGGLIAGATVFPRAPLLVKGGWRRLGAPVLILLFAIDLFLSGRDILPPLVRLLLVLLAVRAVAHRTNREDMQLLLLAMFLSVASGVFTLSMLFAVQALLFTLLAIGLLFLANLLEDDDPETADWESFRWRPFLRWLRLYFDRRMVGSLFGLLALLLVTSGLLFVAIPRVYLDRAIPFLRLPQQGMTGFNHVVRFGDVTRITQDNGIAMRVDVPSLEAVPGDPYWRMLVLDRYRGGVFQNSFFVDAPDTSSALPVHKVSPYPRRWFEDGSEKGTWTFYLEGGVSRYLPVLGPFAEMRFQGRQSLQSRPELFLFRIPEATSSVFSYQVDDFLSGRSLPGSASDRPLVDGSWAAQLRRGGGADVVGYPATTMELALTDPEKEFLERLVEVILGDTNQQEVLGKAEKISAYLKARHGYSLSPGSFGEGDPVVQWLREERDGHCELFAGAFTLLARKAGIPTRMVVGFSGGSWNAYEDYFVVRNRNAHAWCEVFADGDWVRFDPTPGSSGGMMAGFADGSRGGGGFITESDFSAWVDSLRVMWYRRVINFDDSSQKEIVEGLAGAARAAGKELMNRLNALARKGWETLVGFGRGLREGGGAWGVLAAAVAVFVGVWRVFRRFARRLPSGRSKRALQPLRRKAARELRRLDGVAEESRTGDWVRIREELLGLRFGPDPDPEKAVEVFAEVRKVIRKRTA